LITWGINEKTGGATDRGDPQGRPRLLDKYTTIYRDIICARRLTDPPDPLADIARFICGPNFGAPKATENIEFFGFVLPKHKPLEDYSPTDSISSFVPLCLY
jgi:hypothetical protein